MSKEKRRIPKLRFPGFTEDWEQCKLGEIFEYLQNNTLSRDSLNYKNPNIKNIHYGDILVKFDEILDGSNKDIPYINSEVDLSKFSKSLLRDGDIIFSDTAEDDTVGKAIELQNVNAPFILSGLHTIPCRPIIPFGKGYLGNFLNSASYRLQLRPLVQGIKVSSISKSALKDTMIEYPINLDEQEKIGSLFYYIAKMITLHQRKLDNLKLKKKALLQKLFPKNGERYPELRFPGFTDAWEQRKLSEVTTCFDNLRVPVTASDRVPGKIPYYGANGIQDYVSGYTHSGEFVLIAEDGANDLNDYPIQYVNGAIWVNNHAHVIAGYKEKLENKFLSYSLKTVKMSTFIVGGGRSKLNLKALLEISISMPNYDEQCCIGKFIETIDKTITLHQRKLDHLQLQKKALLQQMFV